ncbi:MAG TPA: glycoside hydrolase family 32 protein [Puia sp.]|nr:glycoside hydrolase family 32 protein [Puia sp.]
MLKHLLFSCIFFGAVFSGRSQPVYGEPFRPQIHFSPATGWMNDPNGQVYFAGTYHLFYQYYPDSTVWGPMHWGHAVSRDLVYWKPLPIALFPDSLGYIFSGSAVVDSANTGGFSRHGEIPLIAVFTQHDPKGAADPDNNHFQNQGIAYSLDSGKTWTKYAGNPVLRSPGLKDFRDPKLSWYAGEKKWIITLAAGDHIVFYSSKDLKHWEKESEFGQRLGAHGGVWECPDLISFSVNGKKIWVLIVNINPGGPQGGSATQYFTGGFDGNRFVCNDTTTKWADWGPDNYAGVTYSNTGKEKIFLGWMSNWQYATKVPTVRWRSAMTIPRLLDLNTVSGKYFLTMKPLPALKKLGRKPISASPPGPETPVPFSSPARIDFDLARLKSFSLRFSNAEGQELVIGFDEQKNAFFIDRTKAGRSDFGPHFAARHYAPRIGDGASCAFTLIIDQASVELFADGGLTTMTEIFFPSSPYNKMQFDSTSGITGFTMQSLNSIWKKH